MSRSIKSFFIRHYRRFLRLVRDHWRAGMSPHKMALSCAVSLLWGSMPMLGPVTALSLFSSWALRVSVPLVMGLTVLVTPLQAALAIPFQRLGARWFPVEASGPKHLAGMIPWLETLGAWQIQALQAWILVMLPVSLLLYLLVRLFLQWRAASRS